MFYVNPLCRAVSHYCSVVRTLEATNESMLRYVQDMNNPGSEMDVEYKLSFIPRVDARLEEVYNYVIPAVRVYRLI